MSISKDFQTASIVLAIVSWLLVVANILDESPSDTSRSDSLLTALRSANRRPPPRVFRIEVAGHLYYCHLEEDMWIP